MWISQFQYYQLRASHSLNILSHVLLTDSIFSQDGLLGSVCFFQGQEGTKGSELFILLEMMSKTC